MGKKALIAYFSAGGVTARAAREMAEATGADLYEIRPAAPYTAADLNWRDKGSRCTREMTDPASRPALAGELPDLSRYDVILLGFPIWWGVEPRVVDTFLEGCDTAGRRMIPFATSGGSGIGYAEKSLHAHCPGADWQQGRLIGAAGAAEWARSVLNG